MEQTMANFITAATQDHPTLVLGLFRDIIMKITTKREGSTASSGFMDIMVGIIFFPRPYPSSPVTSSVSMDL
jgi:hypothetical protein